MKVKKIETSDGSYSLYAESLNDHYHSVKGALQESRHVFIEAGFKYATKQHLKILEIGFGTGLNALLALQESEKSGRQVNYITIEKYPLPLSTVEKMNYDKLTGDESNYYGKIHRSAWESSQEIIKNFSLKKIEADLLTWQPEGTFNLVFFDAFGPDKQPEMWKPAIFEKIFAHLETGAIFVTYTAKGTVRRWLEAVGFTVERLQGPPGKRHMTRAVK